MDLLSLIIGALIGAAIAYGFSRNQATQNEEERAFELKKVREELERSHDSRLQAAIQAAREDYETHLSQRETELKQAHQADLETQLTALRAEHQQELETQLTALRAEHQQELETQLTALQTEHQQELETQQAALRTEHQQELETQQAALQTEHQQELETQQAALRTEPSPTSIEDFNNNVPQFDDFDALLEPVEEDETLERGVQPENIPSVELASAAQNPAIPEAELELIAETDLKPVLEAEIVQEKIISAVPQSSFEETIAAIANPIHLRAYLRHPSHRARASLAGALGKIVRGQPMRAGISQAVETLAILARDRSPEVRQAAIEAIANVKSDSVIPLLQRALRDSDRNVVKAASAAISRFKFYPKKRMSQLPFNAAYRRANSN
ncbi:MAG: HEAT repeat domain-containing protein [Cyanobacteriota bacterium]|nr:HEAT repeat domain-containing protein [Cyanobacteriota bacterium]